MAAPATAPDPMKSVKVFAPFIGEWRIDAKWDSGAPLQARGTFEWELGGAHLRTATFLPTDTGEAQRYLGIISYHPGKKSLVSYSFAVDGGIRESLVSTTDGKTFLFGFEPFDASDPANLRQTLVIVDPDTYTWLVEMKQNGEWKRMMLGEWKRVK